MTFTTSESTTDFVVGDIDATNGALSSFTGSGTSYTATFTPSGVGACTIDVATNTFTDGASNNNTAATQFNWTFDNVAPTVTNVTSTKADGSYKAGTLIPITITFSEAVNVTGIPQITLETGSSDAVVDYSSGTGSNTLTFNYTVATGHNSSDLDFWLANNFTNSGTIKDAALNVATLTLAIPGATNSLSNSIALVITNAPVATAQSVLVTEQTALTVTLSGTDPNGTTPSIYIIEALPTSGTLSDNDTIITDEDLPLTTSSADVVYISTSDSATSDSFTFMVNDGEEDSTAAAITITITAVNDTPVATADSFTATEQIALTVTLSGTDPDGTTPSIYIIEALPTSGTLSDNDTIITDEDLPLTTSSADVVYTSTSDTATSDSFTFKVNDGTDDSTAATVSLAITGVNDVPVAVANTLTVVEDASITNTNVIANDNDVDGDTLSLTAATTAGSGTVAVNADGLSVDYTPAANFNGTEVITYTVSDGTDTTNGTFTITVTAVNDAPVAVANTLSVAEDAALTSTDVIANDTDVDQNNSYSISVTASGSSNYTLSGLDVNGNVTGNDPNLTFSVGDQITFSVNAAGHPFYLKTLAGTGTNNQISGITNNGTVNNNIVWTPTATGTYYYQCSLHSSMVGTITIVNSLSLTAVTTAGGGTVAINADGLSVDYTPAANFNGTEVITYTVSDGTDTTNGTFTITVTAVNDAPVAVANTLTVAEDASITNTDVIANDTDGDGDTLSLTAATTAGSGTVAVNADGLSVDYTPAANFNGTEVITYTVSDGTLTDATGTFTVTVTAVNDAPVAVANTLTVAEDASITNTDVIANDTDGDGDTLSLTAATTAGSGTVAVNADGLSVDYTPAANFNGTEVITYTVSDGTDTTNGTFTITVTAVNDAPVAVANTLTVAEDASITNTDVIANDTDVDGDTLSLTAATTAGIWNRSSQRRWIVCKLHPCG